MKHKIPTHFRGVPVKGAIERALAPKPEEQQPQPTPLPTRNQQTQNPEQYILLPENTSPEPLQHPNLLIAQELSYKNQNWQSCYDSLQKEDSFMLPPWLFIEFLNHLKSGNTLDGDQNQIPQQRIDQILDSILTIKSPYRAEWLNAQFEDENITHLRFTPQLTQISEPLEDCLMQDKIPGINLDSWLQNPTLQGLPQQNIQDGDLYFWHPRNNCVAGFFADSLGVSLDCYGYPSFALAGLGVRVAKIF